MQNYINLSKMQCRTMAWMRDGWPVWIVFTDRMSVLRPVFVGLDIWGYQHLNITNLSQTATFFPSGIDNIEKRLNAELT